MTSKTLRNLLAAHMLAAAILAGVSLEARALVLPKPQGPEQASSPTETDTDRREVRIYYSSEDKSSRQNREIRLCYRSGRQNSRHRKLVPQSPRLELQSVNQQPGSPRIAEPAAARTLSYRNRARPTATRRRAPMSPTARSSRHPGPYTSQPETVDAVASWYGRKFHGRRTASGEIYNMHELTAAHRTLPFGTIIHVTNLRNGQQTVVRINDRGPFVAGREIDLSFRAAYDLGMLETGVERVRLEILPG